MCAKILLSKESYIMFKRLFSSLRADNNNDPQNDAVRRQFERRDCDKCVTVINGKTYPVENWSLGGVLVNADEREFTAKDNVEVTLKFKLRDRVIDVPQDAFIIRKARNKVAVQFKPLTQKTRGDFQNVLDDYVASQFAASQSQF